MHRRGVVAGLHRCSSAMLQHKSIVSLKHNFMPEPHTELLSVAPVAVVNGGDNLGVTPWSVPHPNLATCKKRILWPKSGRMDAMIEHAERKLIRVLAMWGLRQAQLSGSLSAH
ncbi:hypothetical protein AB4Z52_35675 [Rhizobium sp. 2YAF20]